MAKKNKVHPKPQYGEKGDRMYTGRPSGIVIPEDEAPKAPRSPAPETRAPEKPQKGSPDDPQAKKVKKTLLTMHGKWKQRNAEVEQSKQPKPPTSKGG